MRPSETSLIRRTALAAGAVLLGLLGTAPGASATGMVSRVLGHPSLFPGTALGSSAAVVGGLVALGAPRHRTPGCLDRGLVVLFDPASGARSLELLGPEPLICGGELGFAVAEIDGDLLAAAPFAQTDVPGESSGVVYRVDVATGAVVRTYAPPQPATGGRDDFGVSLATAGGELFVGATSGTSVEIAGFPLPAGVVYRLDAATGDVLGSLASPAPAPLDQFGRALAIAGGRLFVGAPGSDFSPSTVHAFAISTGELLWSAAPDSSGESGFGSALAISGGLLAVGAPFGGMSGRVHLLDPATGSSVRVIAAPEDNPPGSTGPAFGASVAADGAELLVGAPFYRAPGDLGSRGAAYLIDAATGALRYRFHGPDGSETRVGAAVTSIGGRVVAGAPGLTFSAFGDGGAFVFETCRSLGDGATCDDGDGCSRGDVCSGEECVAGPVVDCGPAPQCRVPGCQPVTGGCHTQPLPDGSRCLRGGPPSCSVADQCFGGTCFQNPALPPPSLRDVDFDGICSADDSCPEVANPGQEDADGDHQGDACDARDGLLVVHRTVLRGNRRGLPGTGRVTARGELLSRSDGPGLRAFDPDDGVAVRITDAAAFSVDVAWPGSQCSGSGRLRCIRADRPAARIAFRPLQQRSDGLLVFTFDLKLDGVDVVAPLVPPLRLSLVSQPGVPILGFDRVGGATGCRTGRTRVSCRIATSGSASQAFLTAPETLVE